MSKANPVRSRIVAKLQQSRAMLERHAKIERRLVEGRNRTIIEASKAGLSGPEIAKATGLTKQRISQIIGGNE